MKDKKRLIILSSIILGVLVLTLGITYAAFTYNKTGETSKLVLGDIWMKYTENNQLILGDAMPMDINNYTTYKVNPVMTTQEINELSRCASILIIKEMPLTDGETMETFCKGTGKAVNGSTFQENLDNGDWFPDELIQEFTSLNIVVLEGESYTVNPVMASQSLNELSSCVSLFTAWEYEFDEGSTAESYCKGTGTAYGMTLQENIDDWIADAEEYDYDFLEDGGQSLLDMEIINQKLENLPYFEFTISGKNTYTKEDIWYDIVLTHGDNHETRTTRIRDNLLRFSLAKVEGNSETFLLNNRSYSDLTNQRIYVETIPANTTTEINNKYRLYMWISEDTVIGNVNQDYTMKEWEDVFASVKVGVTGDFTEKIVETPGSCFEYDFAKIVNPEMATQDANDTSSALYRCIEEMEYILGNEESLEAFCRGTGTIDGYTLQETFDFVWSPSFEDWQYYTDANILINSNQIKLIDYDDSCGNYVILPRKIDGYDVVGAYLKSNHMGYGADGIFSGKKVNTLIIQDNIKVINSCAFASYEFPSMLTKVVLPDTITAIGVNAFSGNILTTIDIPQNVKYIGDYAFNRNYLISLDIPDSVTTIGEMAFRNNQLQTVTIGNGIQYIDRAAFQKNSYYNPNLESITFTSKTCAEIKNIQGSSNDETKYFPWLDSWDPLYYQEGYKADIIGTDGVCSY